MWRILLVLDLKTTEVCGWRGLSCSVAEQRQSVGRVSARVKLVVA